MLPMGDRITRAGIKYSNIDPDHEIRAEPRPTGVSGATEAEPVFGIDVALGDRHEAGEAGFRGEQVVVARIQRSVVDAEPDREQLADGIEQEVEFHLPGESLRQVGDRLEPSNEYGRRRWSLAGHARRRIGCFGECRELGPAPRRL